MPPTTQNPPASSPAQEPKVQDLLFDHNAYWTMYYRHGVNATLSKNFFFEGSLHQAVERAQKHCGIMGYKYMFLRPMIVDICKEERVQLGLGSAAGG